MTVKIIQFTDLILQMRRWWPREAKLLPQGHTASTGALAQMDESSLRM